MHLILIQAVESSNLSGPVTSKDGNMLSNDFSKPLPFKPAKSVSIVCENGKWKFEFGKGIAQSDIERIRRDIMAAWKQ